MILKEKKYTQLGQGLAPRFETPCCLFDVNTTYMRLKNDLTVLNGKNKLSMYHEFMLVTKNANFNTIFHRGTSSSTWVQVMISNYDVYIDVLGVTNGRYIFNDLVYEGFKYELLALFDGNKVSDKVTIILNGREYTANTKPASEPTSLATATTIAEYSTTTSNSLLNGQLYCSKIWDKIVTLSEAKASLQSPILDITFNSINNSYQFDRSGNNNHALWNGTAHYAYSEFAQKTMATLGYSLYQKSANPDIYVPYSLAGTPLTISIGTDIPSGYSKTADVPGSATNWNKADAIVNFNYWGGNEAAIEIFNRANTTMHNATSRASAYYESANRRVSYKYHINEITSYATMNSFFNNDYQDRVFPKMSGYNLMELLNYATKKTGDSLATVLSYIS